MVFQLSSALVGTRQRFRKEKKGTDSLTNLVRLGLEYEAPDSLSGYHPGQHNSRCVEASKGNPKNQL